MHTDALKYNGGVARGLLVLAAVGLSLLSAGCSSDPETTPEPAPKQGAAALRFSASNTVRSSPNLVDMLKGTVYGAIWLSEDVSVTGPRDDAIDLASVEVAIDLTANDPTELLWTSSKLNVNRYVFLGFFDVDANGSETHEPDAGDPVTLPFTNQFDILQDQEVEATAIFDLVYN